MPLWWTNRSLPGSSGVTKPKPFSSLNHFTVPVAMLSSDVCAAYAEDAGSQRPTSACTTLPTLDVGLNVSDGSSLEGPCQRSGGGSQPGARPGIIAGMEAHDLLCSGHEALARGDWEGARSLFEQAGELGETAEVLDGLSQAAHFQGQYASAIELKERAFAAYRQRGNRVEAAELARWVAFLHGMVHGNMAAASGWMARAASPLAGREGARREPARGSGGVCSAWVAHARPSAVLA